MRSFCAGLARGGTGAANGAHTRCDSPTSSPPMTDAAAEGPTEAPRGRFAAFRHRSFVTYWVARLFTTFGAQILSTAVIWQVYDITRNTYFSGLVGLVQFLPALLLVLVTGTAADRFGRRLIMGLSVVLAAVCAFAML